MEFYYIYKPLAHPEYNNYISPFSIEERLMHVAEAKRTLGSAIPWLADTMDNAYYDAVGETPNSEYIVDPEGVIVARRAWSNPDALRADLVRLLGKVDNPTTIADLDLPTQPPIPTISKGIIPRVERHPDLMPMLIDPVFNDSRIPFYAKLRAEATPDVYATGSGGLYVGFHLDPLYRVHWNNEVDPLEFEITAPEGVTVTPSRGVAPDPEAPADADPREFLLEIEGGTPGDTLDLRVQYFACDDALTFCIPVRQDYKVHLAQDTSHGRTIRTGADNLPVAGRVPR